MSNAFTPYLVLDGVSQLNLAEQINKQKSVGIMTHAFISKSLTQRLKTTSLTKICDSGVWLKNSFPISYQELFSRYEEMNADYGIMLDVLGDTVATLDSAREAMDCYTSGNYQFSLVGVAQGETVEDYLFCTKELLKMGYTNIAIGGMLKKHGPYTKIRQEEFLAQVLSEVRKVWDGWLFCLGCYHTKRLDLFEEYQVTGADSKRWVFQYRFGVSKAEREKQLISSFLQPTYKQLSFQYHAN